MRTFSTFWSLRRRTWRRVNSWWCVFSHDFRHRVMLFGVRIGGSGSVCESVQLVGVQVVCLQIRYLPSVAPGDRSSFCKVEGRWLRRQRRIWQILYLYRLIGLSRVLDPCD